MKDLTIGGLSVIANFNPSSGILVQTPIEGLDSPNYRNNIFSNPGRNGVTVSSQFYDARIINLTGVINGNGNPMTYESLRNQLSMAVQIKKDKFGYPLPIRMTFTTMAGSMYYIDAYFDKPTFSYGMPNYCEFQLTATAANPFIYGNTTQSFTVYPATAGGYITPFIDPYVSSNSSGGSVTTNNAGAETSLPVINIYGTVTNPVITNTTTGKVMRLNYTVNSGDIITIDMYNQTIVLNASSSQIDKKTIDSDWWGLAPGVNVITLTTGSTSDAGYVSGVYNPPYVGV